jgi:hypothetical protein
MTVADSEVTTLAAALPMVRLTARAAARATLVLDKRHLSHERSSVSAQRPS